MTRAVSLPGRARPRRRHAQSPRSTAPGTARAIGSQAFIASRARTSASIVYGTRTLHVFNCPPWGFARIVAGHIYAPSLSSSSHLFPRHGVPRQYLAHALDQLAFRPDKLRIGLLLEIGVAILGKAG